MPRVKFARCFFVHVVGRPHRKFLPVEQRGLDVLHLESASCQVLVALDRSVVVVLRRYEGLAPIDSPVKFRTGAP